MSGSRRSNHRSSSTKQKESSRRSKLYERYNVKVEEEIKGEEKPLNQRPIQELSNLELCKLILQNLIAYLKTNKLISLMILMLLIIIIDEILASIDNTSSSAIDNTAATTDKAKKPFGQLDADSHKRNNPFAEEGSYTVMEGFLEVKRVGNKTKQELELQEMYNSKTKAWWSHLCPDKRYELERHDYESRHGDICRAKGGGNLFECPLGCHGKCCSCIDLLLTAFNHDLNHSHFILSSLM